MPRHEILSPHMNLHHPFNVDQFCPLVLYPLGMCVYLRETIFQAGLGAMKKLGSTWCT